MPYQITNLKKLLLSLIQGDDLIVVTDVTSSDGKPETKNISISEFTNYSFTSSNVFNTFRTGSYNGILYGVFTGSIDSSSLSITSSNSLYTNHLNYSSQNGTSSYSINSVTSSVTDYSIYSNTSSFVNNSDYSTTASYVFYNSNIKYTQTSDTSSYALTSSISNKARYIIPSDNNGTIYHSFHSDKSSYADNSILLDANNVTTMSYSYQSLNSKTSTTASFAPQSLYSEKTFRAKSILSNVNDCFAHCSFKIDENFNVLPLTWYNISKISLITEPDDFPGCMIVVNYDKVVPTNLYITVKADCSPLGGCLPSDYSQDVNIVTNCIEINKNISCWGVNCSNTSGIIYIHNLVYTKTPWDGGAWEESRYLSSQSQCPLQYMKNAVFSFAAFSSPANVTGSSDEKPPTTLSSKC